MEQKNTIVKCARRNCLWNYRGTCDRYVIPISADGQCGTFVETAPNQEEINAEALAKAQELHQLATKILERQGITIIPSSSEPIRGQREKCIFYEDACDDKEVIITAIQDELVRHQMCWYCDNGSHGNCKLTAKPSLDRTGKCPRYTSTGGNG